MKYNKRIVSGFGSVEEVDSDGDYIPIPELEKAMKIYMARGSPLMYQHSNQPCGRIVDYEIRKTPNGIPGLYLEAELFQNYRSDDKVWDNVRSGRITGFSLGGQGGSRERSCSRNVCKNIIKHPDLWEFSLVENPSNFGSKIDYVSR